MTPERLEELKQLQQAVYDARDEFTKACNTKNRALLEEADYRAWVFGRTKQPPDWLEEITGYDPKTFKKGGTKKKPSKVAVQAMIDKMTKEVADMEKEGRHASSRKQLWRQ